MHTSKQIIDAMLRGSTPERVGFTDSPWSQTLSKWLIQGYPADKNGDPVSPVDFFGFDMAGCGGWFPRKAKLEEDEIIDETDEWQLVRDGNGAYLKWWKEKAGTPEHVDFSMTSRTVWEDEYRPHLVGSVRSRVTPDLIASTKKSLLSRKAEGKWTHYGHQFIWENMRGAFGDIKLYESLLLDPEWIHDYCRVHTDLYKDAFSILIDESGKPDGIWIYEDLGYKNSVFCSPAVYKELVFPYYKELVEFFHDYDLPVVLHTCGFTEPILDQIVDAGFDGLNPMEVKAGNDPLRIADSFADKIAFIGGLDARVLESHDRAYIESEVTKLVQGMKKKKARYIFGSDHSLSTNVNLEDFEFAVEVYRKHMAY